ncbi:ABC transporter ATP-binding protein [Paracandidimonas soli]|uniref:Peptide/nickel transport system ATP-binding protein n=1 Tax=Paracandidimonas soli TaxID=1917182 RepID=A0A4R3VC00_9BURK|nr:ABC transporter ATP-binding protein [Paracandidimonas soli]TCV01323.1 peptide/nickel transport system ATP-binding protein [Paracandidimonas soli]
MSGQTDRDALFPVSEGLPESNQAGAPDKPVLCVKNLCVDIAGDDGTKQAVSALQLTLSRGQTFALVGESGCGKSMTALALLRLLPEGVFLSDGQAFLDGIELNALPERIMRQVRGARIGIIFQEPASCLNPVMTVGSQLMEMLRQHTDLRGSALRERAQWWLDRVGIPDAAARLEDYPHQFSGGQKQRIMIAIALAARPAVLIADEPTTALDVTVQAQVLELLQDIQREMGLAILLITHDLAVVRTVADHVALMRHGRIVATQPAREFFQDPSHPYARELLDAIPTYEKRGRPLTPEASTRLGQDPWKALAQALDGLPGTAQPEGDAAVTRAAAGSRQAEPGSVLLSVRDLHVSYLQPGAWWRGRASGRDVVRGVSLDLARGETLALLGESGCGKTTLVKALLRLLERSAVVRGRASLAGEDLLAAKGAVLRRLRRSIQVVFQDPYASLDPRMTVGDSLEEGMRALQPDWSGQQRVQRIRALLDDVGLPSNAASRYPHEFSGGQRQRVAIARALAVDPAVLVCDEPTSALDVSVQAQILDLLRQIQRQRQVSYLFITHNFGVVEYLADRIAVMHEGVLVETGDVHAVLRQPASDHTRRLLDSVPRLT